MIESYLFVNYELRPLYHHKELQEENLGTGRGAILLQIIIIKKSLEVCYGGIIKHICKESECGYGSYEEKIRVQRLG